MSEYIAYFIGLIFFGAMGMILNDGENHGVVWLLSGILSMMLVNRVFPI